MSAEELVAAAATATGPIVDGDVAGWAEQVRQAASAQVVIAADMAELLEALTDPELKRFVRKVTGVEQAKGRFVISYDPPTEYTFKGQTTQNTEIRTGWVDEPAARQLARTARDCTGRTVIFFQRNDKEEGDPEAPAAGYRRLVHIEPVLTGGARPAAQHAQDPTRQPAPLAQPAPQPASTPEPVTRPEPRPQEPQRPLQTPAGSGPLAAALAACEGLDDDTPVKMGDPVFQAFANGWANLRKEGQAAVRAGNDAAGTPVQSPQRPRTVGEVRRIAGFYNEALTGSAS